MDQRPFNQKSSHGLVADTYECFVHPRIGLVLALCGMFGLAYLVSLFL